MKIGYASILTFKNWKFYKKQLNLKIFFLNPGPPPSIDIYVNIDAKRNKYLLQVYRHPIFYIEKYCFGIYSVLQSQPFTSKFSRKETRKYKNASHDNTLQIKDLMQGTLFQRCTHLQYCSVMSLGGIVNTRWMSKPDMGSINQRKILVIGNYYINYQNYQNLML